jgi:hypothetical protein
MKMRLRLSLVILLLAVTTSPNTNAWPDQNVIAGSPPTLAGGEHWETVTDGMIDSRPFVLRLAQTAAVRSDKLSGVIFLLGVDDGGLKIFATSVSGNGNLSGWPDAGGNTGLAAADAICQSRATAAGLTGTFKAWLSDSNNDAYCRVHNLGGKKSANCGQGSLPVAAGPWVRIDGFPFSEAIDQLLAGKVYTPVRYDEFGNLIPSNFPGNFYFTNTYIDGTVDPSYSTSCSNWTSNSSQYVGGATTDLTTIMWTEYYSVVCSLTGRLLCMQTGTWPSLPNLASTGKKAFVTSGPVSGDLGYYSGGGYTGLAAGDAICRARAAAAGLANAANFKAWLSSSTVNAKDRITSNGPWVRLDGIKIADNKADLTDGSLFTSINLNENGGYFGNYGVWTGTESSGMKSASTCNDWTSSSAPVSGRTGTAANAGDGWTGSSTATCGSGFHLYCFED